MCLDAVFSLAGTLLVFPGYSSVNWGVGTSAKPPFITGLAQVYVSSMVLPLITFLCGVVGMLSLRYVMRLEDPFHQMIWVKL